MIKIYLYIILIFSFPTTLLVAQTGPGGVGNSSNNVLWLSGDGDFFTDAGVTTAVNGQQVQQWNDRSGNNYHANQTILANKPIYQSNISNGIGGLKFTGNMFIDGPNLGLNSTDGYSYFIVFKDTVSVPGGLNDGNGHFILDRTTATNNLVSLKPITGNFYGFQKRNNAGGGLGGCLTTTSVNTNTKIIGMFRNYNVNYQIHYDGQIQNTIADSDGPTNPPNPRIGRHATTANGGLRGYINEFIVYNYALNTAQTVLINNYLTAKYGLTLGANDIYVQDNPANGDFDFDVAGIGRIDISNYNNAAQSNIVKILNANNLDDNEFLIFGHNNLVAQAINYTDIPSSIESRFERIWRVSEVNISGVSVDVGNIDLQFDLTNLGTVNSTDLRLLVDTDNDGSFADETPIAGATSLGSNIYQFSGVSSIVNNVRFTIGTIDKTQTPLPIKLVSFDATLIKNNVQIVWKTETEINNDYFTIERGSNLEYWESVKEVKGAGNSNSVLSYSTVDQKPLEGISYYRLKQTDFNGEYSYSKIAVVNYKYLTDISIYPNPVKDVLNIKSNCNDCQIKVYSTVGQLIYSGNSKEINTSNWTKGIYELVIFNSIGEIEHKARIVK
ncbi:MAG: T9SS type A sorting domain-containing protein [Bacteroidetes bacterium]|nr:T9SS type A sorting domain-containing protein [Bacteroidota bacterium]